MEKNEGKTIDRLCPICGKECSHENHEAFRREMSMSKEEFYR